MEALRRTAHPGLNRRQVLRALVGVALAPMLMTCRKATAMDRIDRLMALFHRRWACPVMAELHRSEGAKFISLVQTLGANAGAMRQTLDELIDLGWIRRNPGYGHPLRPEYLLTRQGERLAPSCAELDRSMRALDIQETALRKWSMPTLYVIGDRPTRFSEVTDALNRATDRAVSIALKDLTGADLIERRLVDGSPPGSVYRTAPFGQPLLPILDSV